MTEKRAPSLWTSVWFLLFLLTTFSQSATAAPDRLSVVYCVDCVPFHYQDENGKPSGLIIDYWRLWSEKTGIALDFTAAPWDNSLTMVRSGTVDAHAGLFFTEERDKFLDYGSALRETDTHVFFHRTVPATTDLRQLTAYRVGVLSRDYVESHLKERVPSGLPSGFHRIRHYGLFANAARADNLIRARELLGVVTQLREADTVDAAPEAVNDNEAQTLTHPCPRCGGPMIIIETFERGAQPRAPPPPRLRTGTS